MNNIILNCYYPNNKLEQYLNTVCFHLFVLFVFFLFVRRVLSAISLVLFLCHVWCYVLCGLKIDRSKGISSSSRTQFRLLLMTSLEKKTDQINLLRKKIGSREPQIAWYGAAKVTHTPKTETSFGKYSLSNIAFSRVYWILRIKLYLIDMCWAHLAESPLRTRIVAVP